MCLFASRFFCPGALAAVALFLSPSTAKAWGEGHRIITEAALQVQPADLKQRWSVLHRNAFLKKEESISWYLSNHFSKHPDWVDGPSRNEADLEERVRAAGFLYAEKNGTFVPPITYAGPDRIKWEGPRPKTYHYFTLQTEQVNREFARKGSKWYFEKISEAFREGEDVIAAEYCGSFFHAIQDRVSPYHVWDGYTGQREAFETSLEEKGLQSAEKSFREKAANSSLFWFVGGKGMTAELRGYSPVLLGETIEEASRAFVDRLFESRKFAEDVYTDRDGFVAAHLADNWVEKLSSEETDRYLSLVAEENAKLTADVLYTAFSLR